MASSSRNYRNSKKVDEVREVCQNKPEAEIIKILEVFDNDVAKTINAFISGLLVNILLKMFEFLSGTN